MGAARLIIFDFWHCAPNIRIFYLSCPPQLLTQYFNNENLLLTENSFSSEGYQKIDIYAGQADFETVFDTYKFLAGAKFAFINSTSSLFFYDVRTSSETFQGNHLTDKFTYNEAISAVYTSVSKDWSK